jgi:hypothetical protein
VPGTLELVYALREHPARIATMQRASETDKGLVADPFIGTDDWWAAIADERLESEVIESGIAWVGWGSMADHPEFRVSQRSDPRDHWRRMGDIRLYVEGLATRLLFVRHPWKVPTPGLGANSRIVLEVWLESVERRSSGIAPGPNGDGYRRVKETLGQQVHYLNLPTLASARQISALLASETLIVTEPSRVHSSWQLGIWERESVRNLPRIRLLTELVVERGGWYDGGEIVGGDVWGSGREIGFEGL